MMVQKGPKNLDDDVNDDDDDNNNNNNNGKIIIIIMVKIIIIMVMQKTDYIHSLLNSVIIMECQIEKGRELSNICF